MVANFFSDSYLSIEGNITNFTNLIYITISTFTSVRPSGVGGGVGGVGVPLSIFKFLQSYYKVSLMKVA